MTEKHDTRITLTSSMNTPAARRYLLESLMPRVLAHMDQGEKYRWLAVTSSILMQKELAECTIESIFRCMVHSVAFNLYPLPGLNAVHMIPFNNSKLGKKEAQFILGYKGLMSLAYRSGEVLSISADIVREGDVFECELGDTPRLRHVVKSDDSARPLLVYAIAVMRNGARLYETMSMQSVEAHARRYSKGFARNESLYHKEPVAYALKTVLRRLISRRLPISVIEHMLPRVEALHAIQEHTGTSVSVVEPLAVLADDDLVLDDTAQTEQAPTPSESPIPAQAQDASAFDEIAERVKTRTRAKAQDMVLDADQEA